MFKKNSLIVFAALVAMALATSLPAFAKKIENPGAYAKKKVAECAKATKIVSMKDVKEKLGKPGFVLIDCRTEKEFKKGHLPGAINIPRGKLEFVVEKKVKDNNAQVVVYCKSGGRAKLACFTLKDMGYKNVKSMDNGFVKWMESDFPVE